MKTALRSWLREYYTNATTTVTITRNLRMARFTTPGAVFRDTHLTAPFLETIFGHSYNSGQFVPYEETYSVETLDLDDYYNEAHRILTMLFLTSPKIIMW